MAKQEVRTSQVKPPLKLKYDVYIYIKIICRSCHDFLLDILDCFRLDKRRSLSSHADLEGTFRHTANQRAC